MRNTVIAGAGMLLLVASGAVVSQIAAAVTSGDTDTPGFTITRVGTITDVQRTRLAEKLALVDRIMAVLAAQPEGSTVDQRRWLRERMYDMRLAQLQEMGSPSTFEAAAAALAKAAVTTKELGDRQSDLVYRPINPCRYIDTRNVGGPIVGSRGFDLSQTGAAYGGSGACDPKVTAPFGAVSAIGAIALNVTIIGPGIAPGFIGVRPTGSSNTTSLVNWYEGGPTVQAANEGVVSINQFGTDQIEFFGSPTNIVVDVLGIFTMPEHAAPAVIQSFNYSIAANIVSALPIAIPADRPVQIFSTDLTLGDRGVSQVTILQCCGTSPQFLEWNGLNSPANSGITAGFSATAGTEILKLDFSGLMVLEVNDASSVRLHNKAASAHTGIITVVRY